MAALALVGAGVSMYGSYMQGQEQQAAYNAQAMNKRAQAAQVEIGTNRQVELLNRQGDEIHGGQVSAYGHSGVAGNSGSPLLQMEQTRANIAEQISATQDYGNYHATSILTEGAADSILGQEASQAGALSAIGTGIKAGGNYYSQSDPNTYKRGQL